MKILITNFRLAERTASEIYARDIALALAEGGHTIAIFVSKKGKLAADLEAEGIPVLEHPSDVPFRPDVIHGQFNLETITALLSFPDVPAVYMSHGSQQWRGHPPLHPRIRRYIAHSTCVGDWLVEKLAISKRQFLLVPNFVDVKRFQEVRRLPEEPRRALIYDRTTAPGRHLNAIHHACRNSGIDLDFVGNLVGKAPVRPEVMLPNYDLVFASGRSAIEALAAGCAVITFNGGRCGKLVTSHNFDHLRDCNFCVDDYIQGQPQTVEELIGEIQNWDWRNLAPVARRVHEELDTNVVRNRLIRLYKFTIKAHEDNPIDPRDEFPALAEWLVNMADQHHAVDSGFLAIQNRVSTLKNRGQQTEQKRDRLAQQLESEKAKVRAARRLLKDGHIVHSRLRKRIEGEWRQIEANGDEIVEIPTNTNGGHILTEANGFVFADGQATNGFEKGRAPTNFPDASEPKVSFGVELPK